MIPSTPNIVIVRTDDMDMRALYALRPDGTPVMPITLSQLAAKGTTFAQNIVSNPVCLPSRVAFLTGQYALHNGVPNNSLASYALFDPVNKLPSWMQSAGYKTAHIGKWLNNYTVAEGVEPGWDYWFSTELAKYFNFSVNDNGTVVTYGHAAADYNSDVMTSKALSFIRANAAQPFFLLVDYMAPHEQAPGVAVTAHTPIPAPRHLGLMDGHVFESSLAMNETDVSDKPAWVQDLPLLTQGYLDLTALYQRRRLECLMSVDEGVGRILHVLEAQKLLDSTVFIFVSDNGWQYGEHRIIAKEVPYEESICVPLIVRMPGVQQERIVTQVVANIDFAPTLLEIAGGVAGAPLDGISFLPLLGDPNALWSRPGVLLESDGINAEYKGVRTAMYSYLEYATGEKELYVLGSDGLAAPDPWQLESQHANPVYKSIIRGLHNLVISLTR